MKYLLLLLTFVLIPLILIKPQKVGDKYALNINNIYLPLDNKGILGEVDVPPIGKGGKYDGINFLYSGGFFLSGYTEGTLWANAVASGSNIEDYLPGDYIFGPNPQYAQLYKVTKEDNPFGQSWQDWIDAVVLGADFYDGNNDGLYTPYDYNSNGQWDPNEDKPDILGDEMLWCVYHDSKPAVQRVFNNVEPQGIEIRQSVFAYSNIQELENVVFVRYRIKNSPYYQNFYLDDVYFSIWCDADIGSAQDDLVGCDTLLTGGYTYNDGSDALYGDNPPSFFSKLLSGPSAYIPGVSFIDVNFNNFYDPGIDTPLDTAYVKRGQYLSTLEFPGALNQTMKSSIHYVNPDPWQGEPGNETEARNYMTGKDKFGYAYDPCYWNFGEVRGGIDCSQVNPLYLFSGDPVSNVGWICTTAIDQRQMQNIGPFVLVDDTEVEVMVAYIVGRGNNAINSIENTLIFAAISQVLYKNNYDTLSVVSVDDGNNESTLQEYYLSQNYPNPFNPSTVISYQLPGSSEVTIKVFDVLGNEIATLVDEYKPAGKYEVEFNATSLPSGVYFYQLRAVDPSTGSGQSFVETKKMILMK